MYPGAFDGSSPATMLAASDAQPMAMAGEDKADFGKNVDYMINHLQSQPPEPGCLGPPATTKEEQEKQNNQLQDVLHRVLQQDLAKRVEEMKKEEEDAKKCQLSEEEKNKCLENHAKLREELHKRDAQMDALRNMINNQLHKKEAETKDEIEKAEVKLIAQQAVKKALDK